MYFYLGVWEILFKGPVFVFGGLEGAKIGYSFLVTTLCIFFWGGGKGNIS